MRNYIILNGRKSNTLNGLLISQLPPIVKPEIRTNTEEIDGRDGDIVTKLGYSAYDKDLEIGLYGNFDVNDIVSYFDSEGTVIFSNEPDKYYKYQILDEVDYERLLRFKTATVTFHCQPFKYSAVDKDYVYSNHLLSVLPYTSSQNGISLSVVDGEISISGTATAATEFLVPIDPFTIYEGNYGLKATASGTGSVSLRVISDSPSDCIAGGSLATASGTTDINGATGAGTYNYLWIYVQNGAVVNQTIVADAYALNAFIYNAGNTYSKPRMTVYGSGVINLSLNGSQIFVMDIESDYITIDVETMQAYKGDTLKNRFVSGDYEDLRFKPGENVISWDGNVSTIKFNDFSRWI